MPMEYIMPSLRITDFTGMVDREALEERLAQRMEQVQKEHEKAWHD